MLAGLTGLTSWVACMLKLKIKSINQKLPSRGRGKWAIFTIFFQIFLSWIRLTFIDEVWVSCSVLGFGFWFFLLLLLFCFYPESSGGLKPLWWLIQVTQRSIQHLVTVQTLVCNPELGQEVICFLIPCMDFYRHCFIVGSFA